MENADQREVVYPPTSFFRSIRFLTSAVIFLGYCFQYMLKISLSIGIVCMVNNTAIDSLKDPTLIGNETQSGHCTSTLIHGNSLVNY